MRIAVALSGGVDSAVAAALLREQGVEVVALTMLLQPSDKPDDARAVAEKLGIEHHIVELTTSFHHNVVERFADTYLSGETPVPCAVCNRLIKFGALIKVAKEHGALALATGHYVRRLEGPHGYELHAATDLQKDQSYFLFALSQEQVDFARFPLGAMSKDETRQLAEKFGLPVARKKDSQDICFVPCGDYASIVQKLRPDALSAGEIVDQSGRVLGAHEGIIHFTVGQRKGLNLSDRKGDNNEPLFVLQIDAATRRVIVGPREALARSTVKLRDVNWIGYSAEAIQGLPVMVKLRSAQQPVEAVLDYETSTGTASLALAQPAYGVAKGQAGVIYRGSRLLGGGWICGV